MTPTALSLATERLTTCAELTCAAEDGDPRATVCGTADVKLVLRALSLYKALEAPCIAWRKGESCRCGGGKLDPHESDCPWERIENELFAAIADFEAATDAEVEK